LNDKTFIGESLDASKSIKLDMQAISILADRIFPSYDYGGVRGMFESHSEPKSVFIIKVCSEGTYYSFFKLLIIFLIQKKIALEWLIE
jgi:hypothetical protein